MQENTRGIALAIVAGSVFGTSALFTRSISGISPVAIAASRLTIGGGIMGILIRTQGATQELKHSASQYLTFLLLGMLSSIHFLFFVLAVQKTFIANALILVNTAPILVLLLAPILLKESVTAAAVVSVAVTFTGAGCILGFDKLALRSEHLLGDLYALGSALSYAFYVILARKLRAHYSSPVIMCWFFGLGAVFLWIGGSVTADPLFLSPSARSWLFLVLLGLLPTGVGHFSYNLSLKYISASKASTIVLLEPVSGTLLAWIFLRESPPLVTWIGIIITLGGICIASLWRTP
jgi:drug/metabolite transporter (DMT)-like permease